ncbi:Uncharacterised protein [Yersinia intermedia]|uniref:cupin domain-containing protein n=1 Tax=Yersinia intermedia TaxID=631 RepID=UPI0005ACA0B7|nr:hypothetical protein [Yersinia intermedia]AJJ19989.1 cupin domain protein [Yersinia intermedia]MDA5511240.1 hypothetical protein [Yersinia intermedia]MDN0114738.1 hypothetical protein [Yersinia intermedia]CNH28522.1 Uncharacterised protein [Yersinia intermedia]CNH66146.1 Uncharacterised protein [Yersinia intermedia]
MKNFRIENMVGGWFVGAFQPTVLNSDACEVGVKKYNKGDKEEKHYHRIATEITYVIKGEVIMCEKVWKAGDIIVLSPGEETAFLALTDAVNVVVKVPGALNDKYFSNKK